MGGLAHPMTTFGINIKIVPRFHTPYNLYHNSNSKMSFLIFATDNWYVRIWAKLKYFIFQCQNNIKAFLISLLANYQIKISKSVTDMEASEPKWVNLNDI